MRSILLVLAFLITSPLQAQTWNWSPAAPHHAAVCQVSTPDGQGAINKGSGVYVAIPAADAADQSPRTVVCGVLTAAHCVSGATSTCTWPDGSRCTGRATIDRTHADVAWIYLETYPACAALTIADLPAQPGDVVEVCGYGGVTTRLRHWWTTYTGQRQTDRGPMADYPAAVAQGDSGGPVLNRAAQVVGVATAGRDEIGRIGACNVYQGTVGPAQPVLAAFTSRVAQGYRGLFIGGVRGGSCPPGGGCPGTQEPRQLRPSEAFPPIPSPYQTPPNHAPPVAPKPDPQLVIGVPALLDLLAKDPRFRGSDGKDGVAGPPGKDAILDYNLLIEAMAKDGRFRGPSGPAGKDGTAGAAGPPGTPATIDQAALAAQVAAQLPPIYIRKRDAATGVETVEAIKLGEGFVFITHPGK